MSELKRAMSQPSVGQQVIQPGTIPEKGVSSKKKKIIVIVLASLSFIMLAAIGAGAYLILNRKEEDSSASSEQEEKKEADGETEDMEGRSVEESTEDDSSTQQTTQEDQTNDPYEGWSTYENPTYGYKFQYPQEVGVTQLSLSECIGEPCVEVVNPGDVVTIDVDQYKLYIYSNQPELDIYNLGFNKGNTKDPKEFMLGDKKSYAIFSNDGILVAIAYDYKYEGEYIRLKTLYNFNGNYVEFSTGVYPMNDITEELFTNAIIPVIETFEY